jgi:hypothetical protein
VALLKELEAAVFHFAARVPQRDRQLGRRRGA